MLGKQDNCQVAVSISLASKQGSLAVAWQLYLPEDWAADAERRAKAGVPEEVRFATKTQIALQQLRTLLDEGAPRHCVLADAGYGVDNAFRQALSDMGLLYAVGITSAVVVWPPGVQPLPPKPYSGMGRPPVMPRRTAALQPMSVKALAQSLPSRAFQDISWREGTNDTLNGRFAAVRATPAAIRVRHACVPSSGCSSNGRQATLSRASTSCPQCQKTRRSTTWSTLLTSVGASSATTRI
jgi:SRSO17 transposase